MDREFHRNRYECPYCGQRIINLSLSWAVAGLIVTLMVGAIAMWSMN